LLSALGIAFIFSLPRVVIALYIQFNYGNNISADTQSKIIDHAIKFSYTYVVALVFLWLNTTRKTWQYYSIKINNPQILHQATTKYHTIYSGKIHQHQS